MVLRWVFESEVDEAALAGMWAPEEMAMAEKRALWKIRYWKGTKVLYR
jgi:hypothetical protein